MIDPTKDRLFPLTKVEDECPWLPPPARGERRAMSTWRTWAAKGVRGVRLQTLKLGGVTYTSEQAVIEFMRVTASKDGDAFFNPPTPAARRRQIEQAQRELSAAGI